MSLSILVISFSPCMPIALDSPRFQPERIREAQLHFLYMRFSNVTLHITIKLGAVSESRGPNGGACPPPRWAPPPRPPFSREARGGNPGLCQNQGLGQNDGVLCYTSFTFIIHFPDFRLLSSLQSIWQFSAVVFPPSCQGVIWSASISSISNF